MKIRLASLADAAVIERIETSFCVPRNLPPEKQDGVIAFVKAGGRIFLCEDEGEIHSAFWIIMVENLAFIDGGELAPSSPLRALTRSGVTASLASGSLCVFSWTPLTRRGIWLYRFLRRLGSSHYQGTKIVGFVATDDRLATDRY